MGRCIIHIGMHKTGSSSIQNSLLGFSDSRFIYADLGKTANHSLAIYSLFADHPRRHHLHKDRDGRAVQAYIKKIETDLMNSIATGKNRTLLISGEDIGRLNRNKLAKLRGFFQEHFNNLIIVGYVRPPRDYMSSAFQERVKNEADVRFNIDEAYRSYRNSFEKFDEVFKRRNVHLWKFDPSSFPGGCVVRDFCTRFGIDLPLKRIVRVNESLSRQAAIMLYTYRKYGWKLGSRIMKGPESVRLGSALDTAGMDKFRFSPSIVNPVLEKNRADIEWMESRMGQSLQEEIGEENTGDVRSESDLLRPDPEMVQKLFSLLGDSAPKDIKGKTPEEIALLVHALRKIITPANNAADPSKYRLKRNTGKIIRAEPSMVVGWAIGADPDLPLQVALFVNGKETARSLADKPRPWMKQQGLHPTGQCGFTFRFDPEKALMEGDHVRVDAVGLTFNPQLQARVAAASNKSGYNF